MTGETAGVLLAAARELRLRRFMGPLPFDVDAWMRQGLECDLPGLEGHATSYHFEVRNVDYTVGTSFELGADPRDGKPYLTVGSPGGRPQGPYPADLDGWRAVVAEFNQFAPKGDLLPQIYIWLHGHGYPARVADAEHRALMNEVIRRLAREDPLG